MIRKKLIQVISRKIIFEKRYRNEKDFVSTLTLSSSILLPSFDFSLILPLQTLILLLIPIG